MRGPLAVEDRVDVVRIDADDCRAAFREITRGAGSEKRMLAVPVCFGAPVCVPARMKQHRPVFYVNALEHFVADGARGTPYDDALDVRDRLQIELGQVFAARVTVERTVEIRSGVRHHVDLRDVKLRVRIVMSARVLACQEVGDHGSGQTFVSDHSMFDSMRNVNEQGLRSSLLYEYLKTRTHSAGQDHFARKIGRASCRERV